MSSSITFKAHCRRTLLFHLIDIVIDRQSIDLFLLLLCIVLYCIVLILHVIFLSLSLTITTKKMKETKSNKNLLHSCSVLIKIYVYGLLLRSKKRQILINLFSYIIKSEVLY